MNYKSSDDGQGSVFSQPQPNNEDLAIATINLLLGNVLDFLVVRGHYELLVDRIHLEVRGIQPCGSFESHFCHICL